MQGIRCRRHGAEGAGTHARCAGCAISPNEERRVDRTRRQPGCLRWITRPRLVTRHAATCGILRRSVKKEGRRHGAEGVGIAMFSALRYILNLFPRYFGLSAISAARSLAVASSRPSLTLWPPLSPRGAHSRHRMAGAGTRRQARRRRKIASEHAPASTHQRARWG